MELSTPSKQHNPISLIRNVYYKNKTQFNKKQINTTHPVTTTSQGKKEEEKSHVINRHAWVVLSITAVSPNNVT